MTKRNDVTESYQYICIYNTGEGLQRISALNVKLHCFSMNCIVGIKLLKINLPVYPHSTVFKNVIALNYLIILKHRNVE